MRSRKIISFFSLFTFIFPIIAQAAEFDYNNIVSDEEAQNYKAMSQMEIKTFLKEQNSYLANFFYSGNNPGPNESSDDPEVEFIKTRSATEIIYNAAQEAKINPQFLLVMLQKEQSLIEDSDPDERQLNYAMGYYCFDGQPCNPRFKGFGKQVRSTALQFRWYLDNIDDYTYQPGKSSCIDDGTPDLPCSSAGVEIKPENTITAALYVYTPHIHGNKLFATIWDRYGFGGTATGDDNSFNGIFPDGALVKANGGDGTIFLISNQEKRPFGSTTALVSRYDPNKVLTVDAQELEKYSEGLVIEFPNYSVLQAPSGDRYLLDNLEKRLIVSDEAFRQLGYNPAEILGVTQADIDAYIDGEDLAEGNPSPFEQLMRDTSTNGIYYVKNDTKAPIIDPEILASYSDLKIIDASPADLEQYRKISAARLKDGTLIKMVDDPRVYVISNGERRLIEDEKTFLTLGYSWNQIRQVSERVLRLHEIGQTLFVE
ncbi:hypothetical protein C4566_02810 [Candidatus Parcubacteria bacterium]|nr:MAG: hypothetical protein C4566_02810 [Candidatus Parcubacteria bacterium]